MNPRPFGHSRSINDLCEPNVLQPKTCQVLVYQAELPAQQNRAASYRSLKTLEKPERIESRKILIHIFASLAKFVGPVAQHGNVGFGQRQGAHD